MFSLKFQFFVTLLLLLKKTEHHGYYIVSEGGGGVGGGGLPIHYLFSLYYGENQEPSLYLGFGFDLAEHFF